MKPIWKITASLLFALLIAAPSSAQYPWPPEGEENVDYFLNYQEKPKPDGLHYRTYQNGKIYYVAEFVGGKPKPATTMYYYYLEKPGALMSTHTFGTSPSDVAAVNYHLNGRKMSEGAYLNQQKTGEWKFYDEQGQLQYTQEFKSDGENGLHRTYYASGKPCKEENYKNGVLDGPWKEWYESQRIKAEGMYVDGNFEGKVTHYHPNGAKLAEGNFKNGLQEGTWLTFHSDGRPELNILYREGKKVKEKRENGTFIDHYASGIPKSEYSYADGVKDGPFTEWYDKGEWTREPRPGQTGVEMEFIEKLTGTQISREGDYAKGQLEGEVFYYSEDGRLLKTENYSNGELVSTH
ncbi:MAG: toxin-antitoxin system YwqK family antitoxin [Flavobacteriales bacterium]|nr:toxin-antitoxin system YwqK family antitoxin [Flavobacteriales bacterium]